MVKLKKGTKHFILRLIIFITLLYIIVPLSIKYSASLTNSSIKVQLNYLYNSLFILLIIFIFILSKRKELAKLKQYKQNVLQTLLFSFASFLFFSLYFYITYRLNSVILGNIAMNFILTYAAYFIGGVLLFSAIFNIRFIKKFYKSIVLAVATVVIFFELTIFLRTNWFFFSNFISTISYSLLKLSYSGASLSIRNGTPTLGINDFRVSIGAPCSGIDSLAMFSILFLLVLIYDWDKLNKKKVLFSYLIGTTGMLAMVILRIYLLMIIGTKNRSLALGLFHENAGWIIFVAYFFIFFYITYPRIKINKSN